MKVKMKSKKILAVAVAAALCLTTATCFAYGKINGFVSHSYRAGDQFPTITKMEQVLGARPDVVESFSNGFRFTSYSVGEGSSYGESDTKMQTLPELSLEYKNDAQQWIILGIHPLFAGQEFTSPQTVEIAYNDNITLYFSHSHYKFVPVDYEITPEEQALMDAGELQMGYGSDEVEDCYMTNISWVKDGMVYSLTGQDLGLSQEDMVQMVAEILG